MQDQGRSAAAAPERRPEERARFEIVAAQPGDLEAVADLFARSRRHCLPFLPVLHSRDEDIAFLGQYIARGQMLLARNEQQLFGFIAVTPGWIEQLYLEPGQRGLGIGRALVEHVKADQSQLDLWCFADNHDARAFYAAQGFSQIGSTEGENEEGLPDVLLRWQR